MDGETGNNEGSSGTSSGIPDEVSNGSAPTEPGTEEQSGTGNGGGGGDTDTSNESGNGVLSDDFDGITITYIDPESGSIVQYARIPMEQLERFVPSEDETSNNETIQVSENDSGAVSDIQLMLGTWCAVVVVVLFACLGALCVNTLIRSLEVRRK